MINTPEQPAQRPSLEMSRAFKKILSTHWDLPVRYVHKGGFIELHEFPGVWNIVSIHFGNEAVIIEII